MKKPTFAVEQLKKVLDVLVAMMMVLARELPIMLIPSAVMFKGPALLFSTKTPAPTLMAIGFAELATPLAIKMA